MKAIQGDPPGFLDFWTVYPRKAARKAAVRAWARIDPGLHGRIVEAAKAWAESFKNPIEIQYCPHASTWLNGERWDEEPPPRKAKVADLDGINQFSGGAS